MTIEKESKNKTRKDKIDFILSVRGIKKSNNFIVNEYKKMSDDEIDIEYDFYN
jgi:hypothetical protein|tara:strand:- start:1382 stop:1540 length:159 start_codon:yes stop_codon:yes gene_type:complete